MAHPTDWDVDQYRSEHEPPQQWSLRRAFILAHKADYPEARLVCLAQCFANMEFLGCRYPEETMQLVRELSAGIADDYRHDKQNKIQRTFVRASDAAEAKVARKKIAYDRLDVPTKEPQASCEENVADGSVTCASDDVQPQSHAESSAKDVELAQRLAEGSGGKLMTAIGGPGGGLGKQQQGTTEPVQLKEVVGRRGLGCKKQDVAKKSHSSGGFDVLKEKLSKTAEACDMIHVSSVAPPQPQSSGEKPACDSLCDAFVLVDLDITEVSSPVAKLQCSSGFCGVPVQFRISGSVCECRVGGSLLGVGSGTEASEARTAAAAQALSVLQRRCYTLRITGCDDLAREGIALNGLASEDDEAAQSGAHELGSKLQAIVGWTEDQSKEQELVAEPVCPVEMVKKHDIDQENRQGTDEFKKKIGQLLRGYSTQSNKADLTFNSEFSSEEHDEIQTLSKQLGLNCWSRTEDEGRFSVVSHKFDACHLLKTDDPQRPGPVPAKQSNSKVCSKEVLQKRRVPKKGLNDSASFILVEYNSGLIDDNPVNKIMLSSGFCKVWVKFRMIAGLTCQCFIGGDLFGTGKCTDSSVGESDAAEAAKMAAAAEALLLMKKCCYTIKFKDGVLPEKNVEECKLSAQKSGATQAAVEMGGKLLELLGWTKNGLNEEGCIYEPVCLQDVVDQLELDSEKSEIPGEFSKNVENILLTYASNFKDHGLSFSSEFSSQEIHLLSNRLRLKAKSKGGKTNRRVCVSQKFSPKYLLQYLTGCSVQSDKYELIPPGKHESLPESLSSGQGDTSASQTKVPGKPTACLPKGQSSAKSQNPGKKKQASKPTTFVLVECGDPNFDGNPILKLFASSSFCQVRPKFQKFKGIIHCTLRGELLGSGRRADGAKCKAAKLAAATEALSVLGRRCHTVRFKPDGMPDADATELKLLIQSCIDAHNPESIGCELLKILGRIKRGQGFGQAGQCDGEPLVPSEKFTRENLLMQVIAAGEQTAIYEVIPPKVKETQPESSTKQDTTDGAKPNTVKEKVCATNWGSSLQWQHLLESLAVNNFVLVEYGDTVETNDMHKLLLSSKFCKVPVEYEMVGNVCECHVGGRVFGTAERTDSPGQSKKTSAENVRAAAASDAMPVLKQHCYTVRVKVRTLSEEVNHSELMGQGNAAPPLNVADGVGGKLLAMMGWKGGGLGKHQQGITEPLLLEGVVGRQGLGSERRTVDTMERFRTNVRQRLHDYASKYQERGLRFGSGFSEEELNEINSLAQRMYMKIKTIGRGQERCLIVSQKTGVRQVLQHVMAAGGETEKFVLIPPVPWARER